MTEIQPVELSEISWDDIINSIDTEELTSKDVEALSYLLTGYSIPESATMAGMSASTLRRHLKENKIMQDALTHKKRLMLALMLNKFQKQMLTALDLSNDFLLREPLTGDDDGLSKSETSIYLKQITHSEFIISKFMDLMRSNPLEGLNIKSEGDGDINIVLNVEGTSALDYLKDGIAGKSRLVVPKKPVEYISNVPMLDERGLPPYGTFGNWTYDEEGKIVCHICGVSIGSKQAMYGHIGTHNVDADTYADVYNVLWDEVLV